VSRALIGAWRGSLGPFAPSWVLVAELAVDLVLTGNAVAGIKGAVFAGCGRNQELLGGGAPGAGAARDSSTV
jgi:hypothetical protein